MKTERNKHLLIMRLITSLLLSLTTTLSYTQITNNLEVDTSKIITTYNSIYKGHQGSRTVISDTSSVVQREKMTCCYNDDAKLFSRYKTYYKNGNIQLDSTIDIMSKRKAKIIVKRYQLDGSTIYEKRLTAPLNKNRKNIPKRTEVLWNGQLIRYEGGKKISEKLIDVRQ